MITCTEIHCTCTACPTQYEGTLSNGQHFYFRYRWGCVQFAIAPTHDAAVTATIELATTHFYRERHIGHGLSGSMEEEQVRGLIDEWCIEYDKVAPQLEERHVAT